MGTIDQAIFLDKMEHELEDQLKEVVAVFQNLPEDVLIKSAHDGGWSVAACIDHLNSYAAFYVPRLAHALETAQPKDNRPFKNSLPGYYFIRMMDVTRSRKKYKAMKVHLPGNVSDPYPVVADFVLHLEKMQVLLGVARTKALRKALLPTSLSPLIKINAGDAFSFLLTHNRRHLEQAKRNFA